MKSILSLVMLVGSLAGVAICFLSDITIESTTLTFLNGSDLSVKMGIFFIAVFVGSLSLMLSHDTV